MTASDFASTIPVEVLGWLMRKAPQRALLPWVLVVSPDTRGTLAANVMSRGPLACSVVFGVSTLAGGAEEQANITDIAYNGVMPIIRATDALVPVVWKQGYPDSQRAGARRMPLLCLRVGAPRVCVHNGGGAHVRVQ